MNGVFACVVCSVHMNWTQSARTYVQHTQVITTVHINGKWKMKKKTRMALWPNGQHNKNQLLWCANLLCWCTCTIFLCAIFLWFYVRMWSLFSEHFLECWCCVSAKVIVHCQWIQFGQKKVEKCINPWIFRESNVKSQKETITLIASIFRITIWQKWWHNPLESSS